MGQEIGRELRSLQRLIHRKMEHYRMQTGDTLTFVQTQAMHFLLDNQNRDVFQRDIEKALNIRRSTATEILKVLERDGYITRMSVMSDARLKKLILTEKAIRSYQQMCVNIKKIEMKLREHISEEELDCFFKVVQQMKHNLKEDDHD